ncbi:FASCICLIN-like arabinogalactan-protein 11 [Perilla frutescens var. hirtella]|uniref:FASCICLIN-like arabinogalactan-protein 11 n=1 Tax=Perilla frutescens var. hirtella TaxID=608512 RepID=A0AAD4INM3_PERFH|nr:FASCICLIN-like arabinogalactan-protein 11 [Perilla frutescens var. hirtella]KAH6797697.1 FASCICLIN-like arabinogalactan-protein 11 [Perilla frutescens var. hirtella]KAH6798796.1 FASCICLIN-like arabinogalactan-protein 11 [Perilla frutescens var. frutescens]KAH6807356.1 FASCICLIN-like arabinogalactan-protein 11 [Perilla frutescens var. frutescens]
MNQLLIAFPVVFLFLIICSTFSAAQSPAAAPALSVPLVPSGPTVVTAAPAPAGPTSLISILKKDGRFGVFIKLLQSTKVSDNIDSQLIDSSNGLTVFAPTDSAFSNLKTGTLNSFTDEQKTELVQFHVLPNYISPSQFQTTSNPLRTQAGGSPELLAMNITAVGNMVNITTGETNTSVANTIYDDNQLAVYEVGKVLLPRRFYEPLPPPPPSPPPPKKSAPKASPVYVAPVDSSTDKCLSKKAFHAMACVVLFLAVFP